MNPKRGRVWHCKPVRVDAYLDAAGALLGYVLRLDFDDGSKITPAATWCVAPDGTTCWAIRPFPTPRPLQGLDDLARRPDAPVLIVEGEKCRAVAAAAFPQYVALTWPGGSKGLRKVDWSPLRGRDLVLWPDSDEAGVQAMLGYQHHNGLLVDGVAQYAARVGAAAIRLIDTTGQARGWDVAAAIELDGWTPRQAAVWAASRVVEVEVKFDPELRAA
jgi:hypothetical protein